MATQPMPSDLEAQMEALWKEIAWLHLKWNEYDALYGRDQERVDFLNEVADQFFGVVEMVMWGDLIMHVSRLTSAPGSAGRPNLTIQRLPALVESSISATVQNAVAEAVAAASFTALPRNRLYAHTDLPTAIGTAAATFDLGSRTQMREALGKIVAAIDSVSRRYSGSEHAFDFSHGFGTADDLVIALRASRRNAPPQD